MNTINFEQITSNSGVLSITHCKEKLIISTENDEFNDSEMIMINIILDALVEYFNSRAGDNL